MSQELADAAREALDAAQSCIAAARTLLDEGTRNERDAVSTHHAGHDLVDAKSSGISPAAVKRYDKVVQPFLDGREKGKKAYTSLNKKL